MDNNWYEKIEDYVSGLMNPKERLLFEEELANNEELASIYYLYTEIETQMRENIHSKGAHALKKTLSALNNTYFKSSEVPTSSEILFTGTETEKDKEFLSVSQDGSLQAKSKQNSTRILWVKFAAVAVLAGIVILCTVLFFHNIDNHTEITAISKNKVPKPSETVNNKDSFRSDKSSAAQTEVETDSKVLNEKTSISKIETKKEKNIINTSNSKKLKNKEAEGLYKRYFTADVTPVKLPEYLEEPFEDYEKHRYDDAITKYKDIIAIVENDDFKTRGQQEENENESKFYIHYYLGQSYLAVDSAYKAIAELKKAINFIISKDNKEKTEWYLALAYLKTNQLQKAVPILKNIAANKTKNYYKKSAQDLLKNL